MMELVKSTSNLMELMPQEAIVVNIESMEFSFTNSKFVETFGISQGASVGELRELMSGVPTLEIMIKIITNDLKGQKISQFKHVCISTKFSDFRYYDLKIGYVDDNHKTIYVIFSQSAHEIEQMALKNGYYDTLSSASFSYPFYLDVKAKRIEFFGPILEQFKLPPIMENFPEPVIAGGMLLEEDLEEYSNMIDRMYKGEPPQGEFRSYTPTGEILKYAVNYVVNRDEFGNPIEVIGDFINKKTDEIEHIEQPQEVEGQSHNKILVHQIKAHFFFNTLNTISALCKQDAAKADKAIVTFASYMRSYMYLINEEKNIPFEQELSLVKSSLEIERLRFPGSFTYSLDLDYYDFEVPPLSIQPIVENALLHGLRKTGRHGQLKISTKKIGETARVIISDDGLGFDTELLKTSQSIGLKNLTKRVEMMTHGSVNIQSRLGEGTQVIIEVPIAV